jgi:hypothetical protein
MKTLIILTGFIFVTCKMQAQTAIGSSNILNQKFLAAMEANLKMLDTAGTPETFIMLANNFERIGKAEQKQWQPFYYAAFCYALMAGNAKDKSLIDPLEDNAESYLNRADAIENNNSEISSLHAMILYTRVLVDPVSRWQTMGNEAAAWLEKARQQNPANPRPFLIEGRKILHTPESLGGGPKAARPVIEKCLARFADFIPENSISPGWGKKQAEKMLQSLNLQ